MYIPNIRFVNDEIIAARNKRGYRINIEKKLQKRCELFSIDEEEALNIIKAAFFQYHI